MKHADLPVHPNRLCRDATPPLHRGGMVAAPWTGVFVGLAMALLSTLGARSGRGPGPAPLPAAPWVKAARARRTRLLLLVAASAALATGVLGFAAPPDQGLAGQAQAVLFALLFAWVSAGCVTAVMGYLTLARGDRHALGAASVAGHAIDSAARTAIVMPICNEDIATVGAGLRATCESLAEAVRTADAPADLFDLYLLSDTGDARLRDAEFQAWRQMRDELAMSAPGVQVYYRWRQRRTQRKAGNVADFCRRWGRAYRYMVVLDADSVMSGEALLTLVRLMEAQPRAGIVQTAPRPCGHDSLHARVQQFAARVTGPLFAAGLAYWQLGESHYWGHNAIIRVAPFMRHCGLAELPGRGGLAGEILSHDFVEAALMRRAGYEVWLLPELEGSYEQPPPHLVDELQRDRRWCQGNLQNARLVAEPGMAGVHRAMFVSGAMSYVASPLWLAFVLLGVLPWVMPGGGADSLAVAVTSGQGAFPVAASLLWVATLLLLFVPRLLALQLVLRRGQQAGFGGTARLVLSAALEALLSALQAPVRMVAHSVFVLGALTGIKLGWKSPSREASDLGWREAVARFGLVGSLVAAFMAWWFAGEPGEAWRVLPLALPLVLAVPLAVLTSRRSVGQSWQRRGWLLTPEERHAPAVLQAAWQAVREGAASAPQLIVAGKPSGTGMPTGLAHTVARSAWGQRSAGARGALASLVGSRRALAAASLVVLALAGIVPRHLATGGLTTSDLAAMRIVMQASSPSAAPLVLEHGRPLRSTLRAKRVVSSASPSNAPLPAMKQRVSVSVAG